MKKEAVILCGGGTFKGEEKKVLMGLMAEILDLKQQLVDVKKENKRLIECGDIFLQDTHDAEKAQKVLEQIKKRIIVRCQKFENELDTYELGCHDELIGMKNLIWDLTNVHPSNWTEEQRLAKSGIKKVQQCS